VLVSGYLKVDTQQQIARSPVGLRVPGPRVSNLYLAGRRGRLPSFPSTQLACLLPEERQRVVALHTSTIIPRSTCFTRFALVSSSSEPSTSPSGLFSSGAFVVLRTSFFFFKGDVFVSGAVRGIKRFALFSPRAVRRCGERDIVGRNYLEKEA